MLMENIDNNNVNNQGSDAGQFFDQEPIVPDDKKKMNQERLDFLNYHILREQDLKPDEIGKLMRFCKRYNLSARLIMQFPEVVEKIKQAPRHEKLDEFMAEHPKMVEILSSNHRYLEYFSSILPQLARVDEVVKRLQKGVNRGTIDMGSGSSEHYNESADMSVQELLTNLVNLLRSKASDPGIVDSFLKDVMKKYDLNKSYSNPDNSVMQNQIV